MQHGSPATMTRCNTDASLHGRQQVHQKAFEKCWAHSPLRAHSPGVASGTVARHLRIDVHDNNNDDDNDNA